MMRSVYGKTWVLGVLLTVVVPGAETQAEEHLDVDPVEEGQQEEGDEQTPVVEVTTTVREIPVGDVYQPTTVIGDDELQSNLGSSVPATVDSVPGFDLEYNGPGAARPMMRGLPGDRVLMLEDGHPTGDIYWTASDHGVMVEPISAQRIEVVRGPAGLIYGSHALGGVVNVVRDSIPQRRLTEVEGTARVHGESVNMGGGAGAVVRGPLGPLNFYTEASARGAGDERTPAGTIEQTGMRAFNAATGASWHGSRGTLGAAARYYDNVYEVPGEFDGELIPGGHPGGVESEAQRVNGRFLARHEKPLWIFEEIDLRGNTTWFAHDEIEGTIDDEQVLGATFRQWSNDARLIARHEPVRTDDQDEPLLEGSSGLTLNTRDLEAGGISPGTRSGVERDVGVFGFEQISLPPLRLQAGARYDFRYVTTGDMSPLTTRTDQRNIEKDPRSRSLGAFSGSISALYAVHDHWTIGTSLGRSFRHPTIEELYSDGPHLADFSYDIGDPDLETEIGWGGDLFVRADHPRLQLELGGYLNYIDGFIHYDPTGETVRVFREGVQPRTTPVFEARNQDTLFTGVEAQLQWEFLDDLFVDATGSYTRATRIEQDDPLPFIPPLSGQLKLRYDGASWFGSVGAELAAAQQRVPRPLEINGETEQVQTPTDGYALARAQLGWRHSGEQFDHTVMGRVDNIADTEWRTHTSQIKEIAPQPGRNFQLSYRADF